jgi:hypothetical protein
MTPRLKILSIGLALSLIYAISDYIARNEDKPIRKVNKEVKKRPKTARISQERIRRIKEQSAQEAKQNERKDEIIPVADFNPIPDEVLALEGWARDPFIEMKDIPIEIQPEIKTEVDQERAFSNIDQLKITSIAKLGDKTFVIINGQRFQEGDLINNMLIESIESQKITFRMGKTRIVKDVGS